MVDDRPVSLTWRGWGPSPGGWQADAADEAGVLRVLVRATDRGTRPSGVAWWSVSWNVRFERPVTAAIDLPVAVAVPVIEDDGPRLFLPVIQGDLEEVGNGLYPRLDLRRGFAVRADRMPQVAMLVADSRTVRGLVLRDESPRPALPGLVLSLCAGLGADGGLRASIRYPQAEWGHVPEPPGAAYLAKHVVGAGEDRRHRWRAGDRFRVAAWLVRAPSVGLLDAVALPARRLWHRARPTWTSPATPRTSVLERGRWIDRHLWSEALGQYVSPEGSETALAGFVEMSVTMAVSVARLAVLESGSRRPGESGQRALRALDAWCDEGRSADGLLLPIRDEHGFRLGRRRYEHPALEVTSESLVEPIRPIAEARSLLGLARQADASLGEARSRCYRDAAVTTARWLLARLGPEGLPGIVGLEGDASADGAATAGLVALLADLSRDEPSPSAATHWVSAATALYDAHLAAAIRAGRFGGVTLDAGCPDREAVHAALEAALVLHEASGSEAVLTAAGRAADVLLTSVFAYPIRTFSPGSDAAVRAISTLGASVVSAENQQLDPFPVGAALVRYGLLADDPVAVRAGLANVAWCLDGRWAFRGPDGIRQSEQLNHTAWHYDAHFTTRGDIRRGMPRFGRLDSEHGWAQVLPVWAYLELGDVTVDWPSGRVACLDDRVAARLTPRHAGWDLELEQRGRLDHSILVRLLRPPDRTDLELHAARRVTPLPWPGALVPFVVPPGMKLWIATARKPTGPRTQRST
jgi:hypothetical protein